MRDFRAARRLAAVLLVSAFLTTATHAAEKPRPEPREPMVRKVVRIAKQLLRIRTDGDYPTIPTP